MEHLIQSINRQSPMKGACANIMKSLINHYNIVIIESLKAEAVIDYYKGIIDNQELDEIMNKDYSLEFYDSYFH